MRFKILIIEDDEHKLKQIEAVAYKTRPNTEITKARSYHSGLTELLNQKYDLSIVDMTMPTFDKAPGEDGGRLRPFAGRDIFEQLARKKVAFKAIVVTGFEILGEGENQKTLEVLDTELKDRFGDSYLGSIHYQPALTAWEIQLEEKLANLHQEST